MNGSRIYDGDLVYVKSCSDVNSGEIAVVLDVYKRQALNAGFPSTYLRLIMSIIFILVLILGNGVMAKFFHRSIKN